MMQRPPVPFSKDKSKPDLSHDQSIQNEGSVASVGYPVSRPDKVRDNRLERKYILNSLPISKVWLKWCCPSILKIGNTVITLNIETNMLDKAVLTQIRHCRTRNWSGSSLSADLRFSVLDVLAESCSFIINGIWFRWQDLRTTRAVRWF